MKKSILIIFLFPIMLFSQTTKDDYEIYSTVINEIIKNNEKGMSIDKLFIIKKYKQKWDRDKIEWIKMEIDGMEKNKYGFPLNLLSKSIREKFYNEAELRKSITGLCENNRNHPKLELEKFNIEKENVKIRLLRNYYFFNNGIFRPFIRIKNSFKKKKNIYTLSFSLINYNGKYASFYFSSICGDTCGHGGIIIMENEKGHWNNIGQIGLWDI